MNVDLRALIGKLNPTTRGAMDAAAGLCLSRTHYDVEVEHFLLKLMDHPEGDVLAILKRFEIDRSDLARQLTATLDRLKSGNARTPSLSPDLVQMLTRAWTLGSIDHGAGSIRSGHTLLALISDADLRRKVTDGARELEKIHPDALRAEFASIVEGTSEDVAASTASSGGAAARGGAGGPTPNLDQYTVDLTKRAAEGQLDPVLGRDVEIRQVVDILTRKRQNNPILVGEAGVGKTAVVEGFAMRIAQGDVPPPLRNVTIRSLDLALLQAGAGVKGEFENRLKGLIEEVKSSETPVILFIDEAHTMIGAGGAAGQNDAANLLKPALARGELRTLAATTWSEYKKYFEKDPALARRFQLIKVEEPTEELCMVMMRGIVPHLERHHSVRILDRGLEAAVRLSNRYLPDRQLPDKAVSVLDTACARLSLGQNATPAAVEDAERRLADLGVQQRVLRREEATGSDHGDRLAAIADEIETVTARLEALRDRWQTEKDLVGRIRSVREQLEARLDAPAVRADGAATGGDDDAESPLSASNEYRAELADLSDDDLRDRLAALMDELDAVQGEDGLVPVFVDADLVGRVISGWTGIPVGKMMRDQIAMALELEDRLGERIIGQDHALGEISQRIRTSKAGIDDPQKPVGVFLLVGPSGVGKTETALSLSELMFGGEENLITINMSEFQEPHTVSTLKGSPPGYVGYGEGGVLTEAVRRRPYSVVLLDEIEKAHPDVLELFFQVFDKGRMEDGEGREIDFKNTIIVLTSNAGTDTLMKLTADPETTPGPKGLVSALKPELDKIFQPAFLGRTVIIPYFPLRDDALRTIIDLKLGKVRRRLHEVHAVELEADQAVLDAIAARCTEVESGARNIDNILTNTVMPEVSRLVLRSLMDESRPSAIRVTVGEDGHFDYAGVDAGT
ncbi:type VI secretion system ATPase TssH [Gemmatimonadota bacterium Y43]|uniref:type VI secretion system ATPase TssH n=1 Tax=Gaopeijia maritima TaxID=3119007 RepID=UPI0032697F60